MVYKVLVAFFICWFVVIQIRALRARKRKVQSPDDDQWKWGV